MTGGIFILDFDRPDLVTAAGPETIAGTGSIWKKEINRLGPWKTISFPFSSARDRETVWRPAAAAGDGPVVFVCGHCTSTMDVAWHFIEKGQMQVWDSVVAVEQTAGRGQRKRGWVSPAGNLHASWYWPLPETNTALHPQWDGLLSLMAGFVFSRVFKEFHVPVTIKWPNDLLTDGRKFAGILMERRDRHILAGIGVNTAHFPDARYLREDAAVAATSLAVQGVDLPPLQLWTELVKKGKFLFENLIQSLSPAEFVALLDARMAWIGRTVHIHANAEVFEAVILGLAQDGGLRIKKGRTEDVIYSGSIQPLD